MKPEPTRIPPYSSADFWMILLFLLCWGLGIVGVGPDGDFPLNDDWAYARSVFSVVNEGKLVLDTWPAMSLIAQIGIGTIYCEIFGFSFETLRWSTLVNSFLCICFFYFLLRKFTSVPIAFFLGLLLFFNPLFFSLSFTFMTEVHFLMAVMGAMLLFSNYIESSNYSSLVLAGLFSIVATLIRQPGVLVPLSFGMVLLYRERTIWRRIVAVLPFLISFLCLKMYQNWLELEHPEIHKVGGIKHLINSLTNKEAEVLFKSMINLILNPGLFLFPLVVLLFSGINWKALKGKFLVLLSVLGLGSFLMAHLNHFPTGNVLHNIGLGPKLLKGLISWDQSPRLSTDLWKIPDYAGLLGAIGIWILLIQNAGLKFKLFFTQKEVGHKTLIKWGITLFCCAYFLVMVLISSVFDRYSLPLIPCLAILILPQRTDIVKRYAVPAVFGLVILALFSIAGTHDYLSWNRIRKEANDYLNQVERVPPAFIDAGFEINGWIQPSSQGNKADSGKSSDKSWWFVSEDDYVLAFKDLQGFKKWKAYSFQTFLPEGNDSLYILKREYIRTIDYSEFPILSDLERRDSNNTNFLSNHPNVEFTNGIVQDEEKARSGKYAIKLTDKDKYGLATKFWNFKPGDKITISMWQYPAGSNAAIVVKSDYQKLFHEVGNKVIKEENGWEQVQADIIIPPYSGQDRISIFIWNVNAKKEVWVDDLEIQRN